MRGRYKVVAQLVQGAFGVTLLVTDKVSNQKYVAKIMDLSQMTPQDKQRVKSEIDCLSQCDHVNVLRHIETYANDTTLVLVTEYADGGDLGREIAVMTFPFTSTELACVLSYLLGADVRLSPRARQPFPFNERELLTVLLQCIHKLCQ